MRILTHAAPEALVVFLGCLVLFASCRSGHAQGRRSDYERAARLPELTRGKVFRARVQPRWLPGGDRFWYRNDLPEGRREFILVDAVAGTREPAFDHARVAEALTRASGKPVSGDQLPVEGLDVSPDGRSLYLFSESRTWECDRKTYALRERPDILPAASTLPSEPAPRASRRTGPETSITFVNRAAGEVRVFWLDPEGRRRPYGSVGVGKRRDQHTYAGHVWLVTDVQGGTLGVFEATEDPGSAVIDGSRPPSAPEPTAPKEQGTVSPDGKWSAFAEQSNLRLRDRATGETVALTTDGTPEDGYGGEIHWSPDSRLLVALKTRAGDDRQVSFIESSPKDQVQPKLHTFSYAKPGDRVALSRPHLFDAATRQEVPVSDALFPNPWSISDLRWAPDSRRFTFLYNQRGHQVMRVIAVDAGTGRASAIVEEKSKTFIDYAGKHFCAYLDASDEILWMSERDGWNHLYLYDARTGKVKNQVTRGEWVVRRAERVDAQARQVWFRAGGIVPGQDPYYIHHARVNLDGTGLVLLTEGDGTHALTYSPDRRFYLDSYSRVDLPPVTELRRAADGTRVCLLERADVEALFATGWAPPERFIAKGRDGKADIYGIIVRPTNLDPEKRYPIIEAIYAGPQGASVPKGWSAYYGMQELAELGFVLVQIDGMGTSCRSKAFHDVCWKNLADAGFPDRIRWIQAAARRYPYLDLSRVGIYGGSAGGQNALGALLFHPEFYKAAAADCGCHDNRMDKVWWNELWMGWPVGPHYAEQSNVTHAHRLRGKLLLTVGEMDRNVDPASTMQVVDALIKADKDFELVVIPGGGHGSGETPYGRRRRQDFFVRTLLGVEPRSEE